jgi:hypothetical protein
VTGKLFAAIPELELRWDSPVSNIMAQEDRIVSVTGFRVGAVIDCSGSAEVVQAIGEESLATDDTTQSPAVIFPLNRVTREMLTPATAAQVLLPIARAGFPPLTFQSNLDPDSVTVKFTGQPEQVPLLIDFLRTKISGFEHCCSPQQEFSLTHRAGRMIIGKYLLTGGDVLAGRKFPGAVARGGTAMASSGCAICRHARTMRFRRAHCARHMWEIFSWRAKPSARMWMRLRARA